ncbi:Endoplasmin [Gossypium arboreum]|uniref:Endoplasmin n=1 Tax=Gossypium arboreum TaxID=29729 RepID=A0A0B0PE34_GOSAR|nr:Endoplasmin [Gossypium arboreum]
MILSSPHQLKSNNLNRRNRAISLGRIFILEKARSRISKFLSSPMKVMSSSGYPLKHNMRRFMR